MTPTKNKNEQPTLENKNSTIPLSQEQKTNVENVKRIMNSVKTKLPSLRNIKWRTLKTETNKINQILPYISTNHITEWNEQIYAGAKLGCEKIGIPSISTKKQSKLGWENTGRKSTITGQNGKTKRSWNILEQNEKDNTWKITVQLEEIN